MKQKSKLLENFYDRLSPQYDVVTRIDDTTWTTPREVAMLILPHVQKGIKVLDIGIGTGQSSEPLYRAGARITGIDISQEMIAVTKKKFPEWTLYRADLEKEWPRFTTTFGIVVASGVLEFVSDMETVLERVKMVLEPEGLLCFTFEEYLPDHTLQKYAQSELGKGIVEDIPEEISFFVYRHTLEEVTANLKATGFKILSNKRFISYYRGFEHIPIFYQVLLTQKV